MDRYDIPWILFVLLLLIDVAGWWLTLALWIIPTLSIGLGEILTLSVWSIVAVILFFTVWLGSMIVGLVFLAVLIFDR